MAATVEQAPEGERVSAERADALVLELVTEHADSLLRVARRYSLCADDAHDAYQRGLEILLRHARRLDPDRASGWLHTVVKHEALAINRSRRRMLGEGDLDLDTIEARTAASPQEHAESAERVARTAEALHSLKPQEVRALWLRALGHSYDQIADSTGWTYTKVNRCLAEGRKSFLARYAGIEAGEECERLAPSLSAFVDGEADSRAVLEVRNHLRACGGCRAVVRGLHETAEPLSVVLPAATLATAAAATNPPGTGFFARVYESLAMSANERAANAVLRAQAVVDTVATGKMAVAAAGVAAVAGGGVAVNGAISAEPTPNAIVHRAQAAALVSRPVADPAPRRTRPRTRVVVHVKRVVVHRPARRTTPRYQAPVQTQTASAPAQTAAPATTTSTSKPVARAASQSSGGSGASSEFGFEGP